MSHAWQLMLTCHILLLVTSQIAALPRASHSLEAKHDARLKPLSETPQNEAVTAGGTVILRCAVVDPPPASRVLWVEQTTATGGNGGMPISDGENILPTHPNRDRYRIIHETGTEFHLEIRDVRLSDAGQYICQDIDATSSYRASAQLVVLATEPECARSMWSDGTVHEDQSHLFTCVLSFQGNIQPTMLWTGPPPFTATYFPLNSSRIFSRADFIVNRDMDEQYFQCRTNFTVLGDQPGDGATNLPTWESLYPVQLSVYWGPKNMSVDPVKDQYEVGDVITCTADAKPEATYSWHNIRTNEVFNSRFLTVTADMRGQPVVPYFQCRASNIIQGRMNTQYLYIYVNVP